MYRYSRCLSPTQGHCCGVSRLYEFLPLWLVDVGGHAVHHISIVTMVICALMAWTAPLASQLKTIEGRLRARYRAVEATAILCVGFGNPGIGIVGVVQSGMPHAFYITAQQSPMSSSSRHRPVVVTPVSTLNSPCATLHAVNSHRS